MSAAAEHDDTQHFDPNVRDRAHAAYNRFQQLVTDIRASPGLERFMRGPSYSELLHVSSANPVIMIAASKAATHALIIPSPCASPTHLALNTITSTDLGILGDHFRGLDLNVRAMSGLAVPTEERGIMIGRRRLDPAVRKLHQALRSLWMDIVKPILDCLGLRVCVFDMNTSRF
jgi:hypothetical protein